MTAPAHIPSRDELQFFAEAVDVHGVLGNADCIVFIPYSDPVAVAGASSVAASRGLWYCGAVGQTGAGDPLIFCAPDADSIGIMARALSAYVRQHLKTASEPALATEVAGAGHGDSVDWLHGLFALDDPRHGPN